MLRSLLISHCFISSREKMIRRRGLWFASTWRVKALPNEPVPPVMRMEAPSRAGWGKVAIPGDILLMVRRSGTKPDCQGQPCVAAAASRVLTLPAVGQQQAPDARDGVLHIPLRLTGSNRTFLAQ